jgi:hypothetical protein
MGHDPRQIKKWIAIICLSRRHRGAEAQRYREGGLMPHLHFSSVFDFVRCRGRLRGIRMPPFLVDPPWCRAMAFHRDTT